MIWLNIRKLESKISTNELSDKDAFNYVLAFFILSALTIGGSKVENGWIQLLNIILLTLITIWGLNSAYKANSDIDGKDFLKRFFAINWVIGMRLLLIVFGLSLIFGIIVVIILKTNNGSKLEDNPIKDWFLSIFMSMFQVIYYLLVINSIRRLKPINE